MIKFAKILKLKGRFHWADGNKFDLIDTVKAR